MLSGLKSRGVADVCIVCCDGLTGLPDAITVVSAILAWAMGTQAGFVAAGDRAAVCDLTAPRCGMPPSATGHR